MSITADRFFDAQEAFIASVDSRRTAVIKRARWNNAGASYLQGRGRKFDAQSLVKVDTNVQRLALRWIEGVAPRTADVFNRYFVPIAAKAFDRWPVDTGLSKSLIGLAFSIGENNESFTGTLTCKAPYAYFINRGRDVEDLIFQPGQAASEEMARALADDLARL